MTLNVAPGKETRHSDRRAEEVVGDSGDASRRWIEARVDEQRGQTRGEHLARHDGQAAARCGSSPTAHRAGETVLEPSHQTDTVLGDREALVRPGRR